MSFEDAWNLTMSWEGGGNTHEIPGDPGGLTRWGISQRAYPDLDIANLGWFEAQRLARKDYWDAVRADEVPRELRWQLFDTAFNSGVAASVKLLQRSINMSRAASRYDKQMLVVDGVFGPMTMEGVQREPGQRLATLFRAYRIRKYLVIAEARLPQFIYGWLRRAEGEYNG